MIEGISHITFLVEDLEKGKVFFEKVFDGKEVYSSGDDIHSIAREKFFLIGDIWIAIMEGKAVEKTYNHLAFKIPDSEFDLYLDRIKELGLEINSGRSRIKGEARSIYFYDYDNHLFELHTGSLEKRLEKYNSLKIEKRE